MVSHWIISNKIILFLDGLSYYSTVYHSHQYSFKSILEPGFCWFDPEEENSTRFELEAQMVFQSGPKEQTSVKLEWNGPSENPLENLVCKALFILSQDQYMKLKSFKAWCMYLCVCVNGVKITSGTAIC